MDNLNLTENQTKDIVTQMLDTYKNILAETSATIPINTKSEFCNLTIEEIEDVIEKLQNCSL